jgi:hypothetical protein
MRTMTKTQRSSMRVNAARERRVTEEGGRRDELRNRRGNTARLINKKMTKGKEKVEGSPESFRGVKAGVSPL